MPCPNLAPMDLARMDLPRMDVGVALPTMAVGWTPETLHAWAPAIDAGPFSSISAGERITFRNVEMLTTLAAAAALTRQVRVFANLVIAPWHATTLLAKQLATLDVLSGGRLDVGLGVGGRDQDYESLGASMARRHQRLDDQVAELRRLWAGEPPLREAPPLGPSCVQAGGPPLYAGAAGPKSLARAARWADGISAFSFGLDAGEVRAVGDAARAAWEAAGRDTPPRLRVACFYALGPDAAATLRRFTLEYLAIFGERVAADLAERATLHAEGPLEAALDELATTTHCDEVILVPGTVAPSCVEATVAAVEAWRG